MNHLGQGDDGHIATLANHFGFAKGDRVEFLRHLALQRIELFVLEENHRIIVADRFDQESFGVIGRGRYDTL